MNNRIIIYFKPLKEDDRFFKGDKFIRRILKRVLRKKKTSSLEMVFLNLCAGFKELNVKFSTNLPFNQIEAKDRIIVLGIGKNVLEGYNSKNKIIAGIGLMTHPFEWRSLFHDYPIAIYLQHSDWTTNVYKRWFGAQSCEIWQAGIDTLFWSSNKVKSNKKLLIYEKFLWNESEKQISILAPILEVIRKEKIEYKIIKYGSYDIKEYKYELENCSAMLFLCEHESQGLAYQEAMSMNVPILAWNQGLWLDPNQKTWQENEPIPASSVPYFDIKCGVVFKDLQEFRNVFFSFWNDVSENKFKPREYILEHLTLKKSAAKMLKIIETVYNS